MAKWDVPVTVMQMVKEFAEVMGQKADSQMSAQLITEEYSEWLSEFLDYDQSYPKYQPEAELKELADLLYVVYGYANARGWDLDEAVSRVHRNNVSRCIQEDGSVMYREDGKILKREGYPKVELKDLV